MKKLIIICLLISSIFANMNIKTIDIYSNKALINQELNKNSNSIKLIGIVNLEDIRFVLPSSCKIENTNITNVEFYGDKISSEIKNLKNKISKNINEKKSLEFNISFLQNSSIKNSSNPSNLINASKQIKNEVYKNLLLISKLDNEIKKEKELLNNLTKKRSNDKFGRLNYDLSCKKNIVISYPLKGLKKTNFYNINYNSQKKNLEIKNLAFLTQNSGFDLENISVNFYNYNFSNQIKPYVFVPEYLDLEDNKIPRKEMSISLLNSKSIKFKHKSASTYLEDLTRTYFSVNNVTLKSGEKSKIVFVDNKYKANDYIDIDGYSMSEPFYKVSFKSDKFYGTLNANFYLDNSYVGNDYIKEIKKNKKTNFYFGTNRFIDIKKTLIRDIKEEPLLSINKIKSTKVWKYTITNKKALIQKINLIEKSPISKHEDIKVKLIGKSNPNKIYKNGKIIFEFELKPNETKTIEFGYEIEKPKKS